MGETSNRNINQSSLSFRPSKWRCLSATERSHLRVTFINDKGLCDILPNLCFQDDRPGAEAGGETRMVGAKSSLLDLDSSHKEGIRFIQLALSCARIARAAIEDN